MNGGDLNKVMGESAARHLMNVRTRKTTHCHIQPQLQNEDNECCSLPLITTIKVSYYY